MKKIHNRAQPQTQSTTKSHALTRKNQNLQKLKEPKEIFCGNPPPPNTTNTNKIRERERERERERRLTENLGPLQPQTLTTIHRHQTMNGCDDGERKKEIL